MASKSPVSAASQQQKVSSTPDAAPAAIPTSPQSVAFPSPQTFDFIPPLHALLLRLLSSSAAASAPAGQPPNAAAAAAAAGSADANSQQQKQSQPSQSQQTLDTTSTQTASLPVPAPPPITTSTIPGDASNANAPPPLEAKDLSTAASAIKIRIQKARAVVENLPDVERTIAEQAEEMNELQERIACLKAVIADFGRRAAVKGVSDDKMDESG